MPQLCSQDRALASGREKSREEPNETCIAGCAIQLVKGQGLLKCETVVMGGGDEKRVASVNENVYICATIQ